MVEQTETKVGLISCSGEEIPEGTLSRVAVRLVLEKLRPGRTVTLCLPLFLSGNAGEREFARKHPTIAVDGCGKLCALSGTEKYSGKCDGVVVVSELLAQWGEKEPVSRRQLDERGWKLAWRLAETIAERVDELLARANAVPQADAPPAEDAASCACACRGGALESGILEIGGRVQEVACLPAILDMASSKQGQSLEDGVAEVVRQVHVYNGPLDHVDAVVLQDALKGALAAHVAREVTH